MSVKVLPATTLQASSGRLVVLVPFDVIGFLRFLSVGAGAGRIQFGENRVVLSVPAGTTNTYNFPASVGTVNSLLAPLEILADYYDAGLWVRLTQPQLTMPLFEGQLTNPVDVLPELMFATMQEGFSISVHNDTTVDVSITLTYAWLSGTKELWQDVVVPLLDTCYHLLVDEVAQYMKSHGGVSR